MKKAVLSSFIVAAALEATQIQSITFNGLLHLSNESATDISGLKVGSNFSDEIANRAIINLYKQGYFENITIEENAGNIIVNLQRDIVLCGLCKRGRQRKERKNEGCFLHFREGKWIFSSYTNIRKLLLQTSN